MMTDECSVNQRIKSSQLYLLDQISILFNYFDNVWIVQLRAIILSFKVCEIVSAHKSIQTRKIDDFDVQADSR